MFLALAALVHSAAAVSSAEASVPSFLKNNNDKLDFRRILDQDGNVFENLANYNILYENCFPSSNAISFKLCADGHGCSHDNNQCESLGEYVTGFDEFLDAFTEMQLNAKEYACEMVRENCNVDDDNYQQCYIDAGYDYCIQANDDAFNVQRYLQCVAFDETYYIGPYCHDTEKIYLGFYTDEDCSEPAGKTAKELGYDDMPYTKESGMSLIEDECAKCREHADEDHQNGGDDADDEDVIIEQCEELYADSIKCEVVDSGYNDCDYMDKLKSTEGKRFKPRGSMSASRAAGWGIAFLAIVAVAGAGYMLMKRKKDPAAAEDANSKKKPFLSFNNKGNMS